MATATLTYTSSQAVSWPADVDFAQVILVECIGRGAAGETDAVNGGVGGGGGEYASEVGILERAVAASVVIGAEGEAVKFVYDGTDTVIAKCGNGQTGGTGSANTTHFDGGSGGNGSSVAGGGGGGAGGNSGAGGNGTAAVTTTPGTGGAAGLSENPPILPGAGGNGAASGQNGSAGAAYGGGGGGSGVLGTGGAGGMGAVAITYTVRPPDKGGFGAVGIMGFGVDLGVRPLRRMAA